MASGSGSGENQANNVEFKNFDIVPEAPDHHYRKSKNSKVFAKVDSCAYRNIMKEWRSLEKDLPDSIYVQVYETRIDLLRAVIIGAEGTPYHNGLFFFDICLPSHYPFRPPKVYYRAHGLRLNPNLYADGKVCLSLLNTWYGAETEIWTNKSTILQLLVSIQGLVLNDRPFFNEDGRENYKCPKWIQRAVAYNEKAFILSCKTMLYTMHNPPKNFETFVVDHFRRRADSILATVMAYREFRSTAGASAITAFTFKWNLRMMHSNLKKVFDTISKPNMEDSERLENVKKEMKSYMFHIDTIVSILLALFAFAFLFWVNLA